MDRLRDGLVKLLILLAIQLPYTIWTVIVVAPILWTLVSSFRRTLDFFIAPIGVPSTYINYIKAWTSSNVSLYFRNSVIITAISVPLIVLLSAMASFALCRLKFRMRVAILLLFVGGLFLPTSLLIVPLFLTLNSLSILGSWTGLIPVYLAFSFPFTVFVLVPFFSAIPAELEEAAFIDGASHYYIFWHLALPLAKSGLIVATIFNIFGIWNEFVLAHVLLTNPRLLTLPVGLANEVMKQQYTADYGVIFAIVVIATAPIAGLYVLFQRRLQGGLITGALKE